MDNIQFPPWYQSSTGPQVSQTIFNMAGSLLPVLNMILASRGINILPDTLNFWINMLVFGYFSIRAFLGYLKSKRVMATRIMQLEARIGSQLNSSSTR